MKKILSVMLSALMVLSIGVINVSADSANVAKVGDVEYTTLAAAINAVETRDDCVILLNDCDENVTISKNVYIYEKGGEYTGKIVIPTNADYRVFKKNELDETIYQVIDSLIEDGCPDIIVAAYPKADVHPLGNLYNDDGTVNQAMIDNPIIFSGQSMETAYSFNAFDTTNGDKNTGKSSDMEIAYKLLGEPNFLNLSNFDLTSVFDKYNKLESSEKARAKDFLLDIAPYADWIADFVVHFDSDVVKESMGVSGYYGSYAATDGGGSGMDISLPNDMKKGDSYRMLYDFSNGFLQVPYIGICTAVRTFECGAYPIINYYEKDNVAGVTMTVELKLFKGDDSIVAGTYSYTFGPRVAKIGDTSYCTLEDAINAVPANNTETVTIELLKDIVLNKKVDINKNNVVLDGKGKSITADPNYNGFDIYEVDGSKQRLGSETLISVSGKNVTVKNLTVDVKQYRGLSCVTTKGGENVTYENNTYLGRGCGHYYGTGKGKILFDNCTINTQGYGIHFSGDSGKYEIEIKGSTVHGWNSFGGADKITATNTKFLSANDEGKNGLFAKFRPYTKAVLTDCEFSVDYTKEGDGTFYCGLDTGAETSVEFYNCSMINNDGSKNSDHEIYEIVDYRDNECGQNSVFTFYPKDCEKNDYEGLVVVTKLINVPVPSGYKAIKLDSVKSTYDEKENVYTVERRKASDEGNVIVIDTEDEEIPAYYENAKDLQDAVNNVIEANEKKEAKKEEVAPTTITVANSTGISAEIDDTIVIIAKDNTESPNEISGVVGYNVNEEILNKGTDEEKTKYTASALNIGEYVTIVEEEKVVKKDGSGSKDSQKIETTKSEEEGVNASDKVLASAGTVNDIEGVDKDYLSGIVADIVKNRNNEMLALKLNQATAAKAINNAAEDIKGKDVSNVVVTTNGEVKAQDISIFIKTYYETVITEDKTSQENKSFKFDIKPMYQAYASTANNIDDAFDLEKDAVTVTMGEPKELDNLSGKNITLTFKLPEGFMTSLDQKVFVIHTLADKTQRKYNTIVTKEGNDFVISFVNPDGFSEFEFTLENPKKPQSKRYVAPVTGVR